jgi:hydrogenase maturation factor
MCLSVPAKVEEIDGQMAKVSVGGAIYEASLQMIEDSEDGRG